MAPSLRFLLPVSLLILFLALVAAAETPLSNKRTLQTEDESEANALESEYLDSPDFEKSLRSAVEEEESAEEDEENEFPFQKKGREAERTSAEELAGQQHETGA